MATRRTFLKTALAAGAGLAFAPGAPADADKEALPVDRRIFHASLSFEALEGDPELAATVAEAGVSAVWVACFFQGVWQHPPEDVTLWRDRLGKLGLQTHVINIPLGHPTFSEELPSYMPQFETKPWKRGVRPDGKTYGGVSLHPPITEENVAAVKRLRDVGVTRIFLDDDYRLAPSPDDIGGCFCEEHRRAFLERHGYSDAKWEELLDDVNARRYTALTRAWVEDACNALTSCFRAQQEAAPDVDLGIMVMYMGSEKAGIRLQDYRGVPFRVGELMFNDESFAPVRGKTKELFSALFHRRYTAPELAYSETTAWPPDQLSATNMAAKLAISTLSDVRNTMFMSGNTPFPRSHWATLGPAMRKQAATHAKLLGRTPRGPFWHYWGERSRIVGDSNSYNLWLALGVPFAVADAPPADGWTFLSDWDADAAAAGELKSAGTTFVHRPRNGFSLDDARPVAEDLEELWAFKREVVAGLRDVPYVEEDVPAVCAWYPEVRSALLWNLTEEPQTVTLRLNDARRTLALQPLDTELAEGL
jgi:hypothetical protein